MSNRMREVSLASVLFLACSTAQVYAEAGAQYEQPDINTGRIEKPDGRQRANTYRGGIARIDITQSSVAYNGQSFGDVGAYQLLTGIAYGTIDPKSPLNKDLVLLDKARRNADGLVPYSMDVGILRPLDPGKGEKIIYEVVNRGGTPGILGRLNGGSLTAPGNGFLMTRGYQIVWSGWQPELDPSKATKAYFPVATNGSRPTLHDVMEVYIPDTPMTSQPHVVAGNTMQSALIYAPWSLNPVDAQARLTVRELFNDARVPLAQSSVTFVDEHTVKIDVTAAMAMGFDLGAIYELVYVAKNPYVGGVGFAATRDLLSFLRHETIDGAGNVNPARPGGLPIRAAYAQGNSQSGRFQRDFVYQGFNEDLRGQIVFDGIFPTVPGSRKTDHNTVFAQSSRWVRQHEEQNYPAVEFPFAYTTSFDAYTGKTDGTLERCRKSSTCPKVFHLDTDFEVWHGGVSLSTTDTLGNSLPIPSNVRLFQVSASQHGTGNGTPTALPICKWQSNPINYGRMYRALTVALDEWVTIGKEPPASAYPSLKDGTLQSIAQMGTAYPTIPGQPFSSLITPVTHWDFDVVPPIALAKYPILVPKIDAYGNPYGGVIMPDLAAPLGTYSGRNYRIAQHGQPDLCGAVNQGSFIPFARTLKDRLASGDSRPSVEELYPGGEPEFRAKRRAQVQKLIFERYILPEELESFTAEVAFPQ